MLISGKVIAFGVDPGKKTRSELGSFLTLQFKKDVMENVNLATQLQFFSNYSENPEDIDINWETTIIMKVNKYISASLINQIIYDADIRFPKINSVGDVIGDESKVQLKNIFGVGLTYRFGDSSE